MNTLISLLVCLTAHTEQPVPDYAEPARVVHYRQHLMQRVVKVRIRQGYDIPSIGTVDGYAARPDCAGIGSTFWLKVGDYAPVRLAQVDCSQVRDRRRHVKANQVEVSWEMAVRLGFSRRGVTSGVVWESRE